VLGFYEPCSPSLAAKHTTPPKSLPTNGAPGTDRGMVIV
jgi:hypothetical protein